jgi:hypothetical protein
MKSSGDESNFNVHSVKNRSQILFRLLAVSLGGTAAVIACSSKESGEGSPRTASLSPQGGSSQGLAGEGTAGAGQAGATQAGEAGQAGAEEAGAGQAGAGQAGAGQAGSSISGNAGQLGAGEGGTEQGGYSGQTGASGSPGQGGANQGGTDAGTGGAGTGSAGMGEGGNGAGGGPSCPEFAAGATSTSKLCFGPDGKMTEPLTDNMYEGTWYPSCDSLKREPGAPCPPASAVCSPSYCSVQGIHAIGEPYKQGETCCYDSVICLGASGCGRPIFIENQPRIAMLAKGAWG